MNKTVRYTLYALISSICIIAIIVGVYSQFFKRVSENKIGDTNLPSGNNTNDVQAEIKDAFKDLFTNKFWGADYPDTNIKKIDSTKSLVYDAITGNYDKEGKYKITLDIPLINIDNEIVSNYNKKTQEIFVNKVNDIMQKATVYTICDMTFTSYINNDILSVAIMASLKEGDSAQRIIVQSYNYDLKNNKEITIKDILSTRALDSNAVNKKISTIVKKAAKDAESLSQSGYEIYQRDLNSDMYDISNVTNFIQGPNGELYIIYAYGNESFTSEMDVIEI